MLSRADKKKEEGLIYSLQQLYCATRKSMGMGNLLGPCGYQFRGQSDHTTNLALVAGYFRVPTIILITRVMT